MPYVTSVERIGIEKGLSQGLTTAIERLLRNRFGDAGLAVMPEVRRVHDAGKLEAILDAAMTVQSPEELSNVLAAGEER